MTSTGEVVGMMATGTAKALTELETSDAHVPVYLLLRQHMHMYSMTAVLLSKAFEKGDDEATSPKV